MAEFEYYPSQKSGAFCSEGVSAGADRKYPPATEDSEKRTTVASSYCRTTITVFERKAERQDDIFCARDWYSSWLSEGRRQDGRWQGQDNPNWNGGVTIDTDYGDGWPSAR